MPQESKNDDSAAEPATAMTSHALVYRILSFYIGVPAAFGLAFGLTQAGIIAPLLPKPVSIIYWITLLIALWLLLEACSRLAARLLRPFSTPLWLILIMGGIIQTPIGSLYLAAQQQFFQYFLVGTGFQSPFGFNGILPFLASLPRLLIQNAGPILIWVLTNYFFDRVVGLPRFHRSIESQVEASSDGTLPVPPLRNAGGNDSTWENLANRLPERVRGKILLISSMDHYLRITTDKGSGIIHGRLADAIGAIPEGQGWQVHRSHWVHRDAIARVVAAGQRFQVELTNGTSIPASARYIELLRIAGFAPQRSQAKPAREAKSNSLDRAGNSG